MRKLRLLTFGGIAAVMVILAALWEPLQQHYHRYLVRDMFLSTAENTVNVGPALNTHFPGLQALSANGNVSLLQPYAGTEGTVLVILRSITQSVYCAEQLIQLEHSEAQFKAMGLALVALVQDDADQLATLQRHRSMQLTLLSDQQQLSVKTLGLLTNNTVQPGALIIDAEHKVVDKIFMRNPERRLDSAALLRRALKALNGKTSRVGRHAADSVTIAPNTALWPEPQGTQSTR
ncbi:MAG: redoxin domain-containing protein [Halioglobus sp.]